MIVNTKGQIVIPKSLRQKFGIYPGQKIELEEQEGKLVVVKKGIATHYRELAKKYHFDFPKGIQTIKDFINEARGK